MRRAQMSCSVEMIRGVFRGSWVTPTIDKSREMRL